MKIYELIRGAVEKNRRINESTPLEAIELIIANPSHKEKILEAACIVSDIEISIQELDEILVSYRTELLRVQRLTEGDFSDSSMRNGYVLTENEDTCFGSYFKRLREKQMSDIDLKRVLEECNIIVQEFLPQPAQSVDRRGLVIGQVQSGKTTIFNGLISASADIGFNVIIVLSGTIESLRRQTQSRITADVTDLWNKKQDKPFYFTWISKNDGSGLYVAGNASTVLPEISANSRRQIAIGVFLKNTNVLTRLKEWLNTIQPTDIERLRVLIIDDEADQATPNGGVKKEVVTAINKGIKDLVIKHSSSHCITQGRSAYLGFTATPFANLLNEAGDNTLYPRDFLYFLRSSGKYYGPWQLFGNPDETEGEETILPLNVIRILNEEDIEATVPKPGGYNPEISSGLRKSILWYILATSAKRVSDQSAWSSMLIHTSSKINDHTVLYKIVRALIKKLKDDGWKSIYDELDKLWQEETRKVPEGDFGLAFPGYDQEPASYPLWSDIINEIQYVIENIKVKIDNSESPEELRIKYGDLVRAEDRMQIAIGGNTLSRGITLEGLVSSYFARRFTKASSYDTLLQMGRWFGFRVGYELLPRLWTTTFLIESFRDLVKMEQDLRDQMNIYLNGESPAGKAPLITQMPAMAITRRNVIGNIVTGNVNYAGTAPQTTNFRNDVNWLQNNINVTSILIDKIRDKFTLNKDNKLIFSDVHLADIYDFLNEFNIEPGRNVFNKNHIIKYINNNASNYQKWSVVFIGGNSHDNFFIEDLGSVSKNNRSRIIDDSDTSGIKINLKSLRGTNDLLADRKDLFPVGTPIDKTTIWSIRKQNNLNPVLLIYPIDKDSTLTHEIQGRASLKEYAKADIIGLSIVLNPPYSKREATAGVSLADIELAYTPDEDVDIQN